MYIAWHHRNNAEDKVKSNLIKNEKTNYEKECRKRNPVKFINRITNYENTYRLIANSYIQWIYYLYYHNPNRVRWRKVMHHAVTPWVVKRLRAPTTGRPMRSAISAMTSPTHQWQRCSILCTELSPESELKVGDNTSLSLVMIIPLDITVNNCN